MKKIFSTTVLLAGLMGLASCSDFLDQTSPSDTSKENVYNSPYYTGLRINKIYGGLAEDRTYAQDWAVVWNMNSDVELVDGLGENATAVSERGAMNYNADPSWSKITDNWDKMYAVIEDANDAIEGIRQSPSFTEGNENYKTMGRYLGEALTLRAMVYFDMIRAWGDIPLKLETAKPDLSNAYLGKTDRDVIMDTLMIDLEEAVDLLPWAGDDGYTTEHVTKGYAHALLAQMAMTRAGYAIREQAKEGYETASYTDPTYPTQRPDAATRKALYEKALEHLSAIILSGRHQLNPSIEDEWYKVNQLVLDQTYRENIFEIPMGQNYVGEVGYIVGVRLNGVTSKFGYGNSTGKMKVTAPLLYSYDPNDLRRDLTVSPMEIKEDATAGVTREYMLKNSPFGLYVGKWDPRKMTDAWLQDNLVATSKHTTGINPIKMRYANVLLYYAECMNELSGSADGTYPGSAGLTARQALALVHNRAFSGEHLADAQAYVASLPSDKEGFFKAIVQENAWEFAGEGFRKWDLIRWNLLHDKILEFKKTYIKQLTDGTYPEMVYFNYKDAGKTEIDFSSITWYTPKDEVDATAYQDSIAWFGDADITKDGTVANEKGDYEVDTQVYTNLPSISSGLVGTGGYPDPSGDVGVEVKNRYLMPISLTTISNSNGMLKNSYGY